LASAPNSPLLHDASTLITPSRLPWHDGLTASNWRTLFASFLGTTFDGYEAYALFLVLPFAMQDILTPIQAGSTAVWAGIAISTTLLGWGIGGLIGGTLADYIGRKRMMLYSVLLYGMFTGLTALSTNFMMFAGLRFLTGLAIGSEWSTGVALVAETWPERARSKGCGFLHSGMGWGALLASIAWWIIGALNPLGSHSWRLVFVVGALPALFTLYIRRAIQESERWIQAVREHRRAATEQERGIAAKARRRPFTLAEIFRERESRRRIFLTFLMSLATMVGQLGDFKLVAYLCSADRPSRRLRQRCSVGHTDGAAVHCWSDCGIHDLRICHRLHRAPQVPVLYLFGLSGDHSDHIRVDTFRGGTGVSCYDQWLFYPRLCVLMDGYLSRGVIH
jgi:hypothetical protein